MVPIPCRTRGFGVSGTRPGRNTRIDHMSAINDHNHAVEVARSWGCSEVCIPTVNKLHYTPLSGVLKTNIKGPGPFISRAARLIASIRLGSVTAGTPVTAG